VTRRPATCCGSDSGNSGKDAAGPGHPDPAGRTLEAIRAGRTRVAPSRHLDLMVDDRRFEFEDR
jgi:hypothetical protein